jgi:PP-loop superfamily ATP-utilizing enzyme
MEHFVTAEEPSRAAKLLESTFWHHPVLEVPASRDEAVVMLERLHQETAACGTASGVNVVAFTGGNGPALTAYLLNNLFDGAVVGCIGDTTRLPREQVEHASFVADLLGIELLEVDDQTWSKFEIPQALDTDAEELCNTLGQTSCDEGDMAMFSGVTADDLAPFTRRGGRMQGIRAPLGSLSYAAVNALSKVVGLPDYSPTAGRKAEAVL